MLHFHIGDNNKSPFFDQGAFDLIQNMVWLFHSRHALSDLVGIAEFFCKALDLCEAFRIHVDVEGFKEINLTWNEKRYENIDNSADSFLNCYECIERQSGLSLYHKERKRTEMNET